MNLTETEKFNDKNFNKQLSGFNFYECYKI